MMMPADWISISYVGSSLDGDMGLGLVRWYTVGWREGLILVGRRVASAFMYKFHQDSRLLALRVLIIVPHSAAGRSGLRQWQGWIEASWILCLNISQITMILSLRRGNCFYAVGWDMFMTYYHQR